MTTKHQIEPKLLLQYQDIKITQVYITNNIKQNILVESYIIMLFLSQLGHNTIWNKINNFFINKLHN